MIQLQNIINGESVRAGQTLPFFDPTTGEQIGTAPDSDAAVVDSAFQAAAAAFKNYKRTTPGTRQSLLLQLADLIEANVDRLLEAEVACTGKPAALTKELEILRGADQLRFFAGACRVVSGTAQTEYVEGSSSTIRREPLGVVAQITPWNYPFMMAIWKIGPALAAGNTLVLKPADTTPWSTVILAELAQQVYPAGVVNVVCGGREAGAAMVDHEIPEMVSITGSTRAGAQVMSAASKTLKDVHLELGGKAPAVVFADVDIQRTAREIALGAFFNAGQDCTAVTRVLVHRDIHPEFATALADAASALRVGEDLGPLNSAAQLERVEGFMTRLPANATVLTGGKRTGTGYYFEPTVIDGVFQSDEVVCDEIFGPVLTVQPFGTEEEALELANGTKYALASSVWSENHGVVTRVSNELDFGAVWINCHQVIPAETPHGGFKHSGTGKDLSVFGLEDYTRIKSVTTSHR
ncbi:MULTISPECIES: gamma-aminobutyraldehyde dehydrogenase [Paenarthrobacter]|uniref:Gamma-aminobutyraldehyde dehydrogenase n=1 Tax=Paenarthrobacter ureafaciens TaxID=37931 RepID=A0AAX3ELC6_PAEUR|nr:MULTISPECIES: gamma-aminobutyraldehyde dehydrogenase [Paenarthrobacter]NKR12375.1 gamma-aminobutyraldehyde dehydrogenase [Arthrobacter sp. M5]NKR14206.1 gamma-aminobutyraldehyde dehydrogenase [Arthrobacter sp. M6]OEH61347.1 gamma-aminobutyraldehyde dehydrogenase [Arthrobacter sp. D2]OEH64223.1 gamma-aminobutyraldehyde dehydrogenase [Arthrobacter sp. D4]MDO5863306.1 gamma-aminobutyraldehyde dehydrogenase [Paenarthrobacter sp. SD-2]